MNNEEAWYPEEMHFQCLDYTDSIKYHSPAEVKNWVKAFVDDFPKGILDRPYFHGGAKTKLDSDKVYAWLDKWFSQFIEREKPDMGR